MAENINNFTDFSEISDAWRDAASSEKKVLEDAYKTSGSRDKALETIARARVNQFGKTPLKTVEYSTDRDIYNALKEVYDRSGGDWNEVGKVIEYNKLPKELINKFVKNGEWTDYSVANEMGSGIGAVARGATGNLYGALLNEATSGKYANKYVDEVPEGLNYDDASQTLYQQGLRQSKAYGKSLGQTNPLVETSGQIIGSLFPLGAATKVTRGAKAAVDATKVGAALNATKLGRAARIGAQGALTGALSNIPNALSEESLEDAVKGTAGSAALFGGADLALAGAGKVLGTVGRGLNRAVKNVATPGENLTKSFEKLKPLGELSESAKKQGIKEGWINKNGEINVTEYLAKKHGMNATQTMEDLANVAKNNRKVYNKLSDELKGFNYKNALNNAAKKASNAPTARLSKMMKELPARLEKFSDDIIGFTEDEGISLAQTMRSFNQEIKHELRTIRNPSALEQKVINQYLKDVESANMKQFMLKKLPSELKAVDKEKSLMGELSRIFQITNPLSIGRALENIAKDKIERNYIRQVVAGEKYRPGIVQRLLNKAENIKPDGEKLRMPRNVVTGAIDRELKKD